MTHFLASRGTWKCTRSLFFTHLTARICFPVSYSTDVNLLIIHQRKCDTNQRGRRIPFRGNGLAVWSSGLCDVSNMNGLGTHNAWKAKWFLSSGSSLGFVGCVHYCSFPPCKLKPDTPSIPIQFNIFLSQPSYEVLRVSRPIPSDPWSHIY